MAAASLVASAIVAVSSGNPHAVVSNGNLTLERYSTVGGGKLLPGFLFMQGESDGLEQSLSIKLGGGRGAAVPFIPDDSCDDAIFEGASPDLRSPQLPYLKYDTWGCERKPATLPAIVLDSSSMRVTVTPEFGGKVWGMYDKVAGREFFFHNPAHQPANIGARGAWTAGGLEFNWSPGYLGHSAFTEESVFAAKLATERGEMIRVYEFDRYRATVFQVDILLDGDELWTHAKVANPHDNATLGYWWTCAAHAATPGTRILAPASTVTVETYVGSPLRNAPWPYFDNGMLNSTFSGVLPTAEGDDGKSTAGDRLADSSFLGNIAYTGDYFLRLPNASRKWIAHVDDAGEYVAVHGHDLEGSKFFTWGQSGPGRFMQDFLAGGVKGAGYYTELQSGLTPTQQQVFTLPAHAHVAFTEYFKPMRRGERAARGAPTPADGDTPAAPLPATYAKATAQVGAWWDSAEGVPPSKVADMEAFFKKHQDQPPKASEVLSHGSAWGYLHEQLTKTKLAPGATFGLPPAGSRAAEEAAIWIELANTGTFSEATLSGVRAPLAYAVDSTWVRALETSAKAHGASWLHQLLLAVAYAEGGEVERPRALLTAARTDPRGAASPLVVRNLAVLSASAEEAWPLFHAAWNLTAHTPPPPLETSSVTGRLAQNIADETLKAIIGNLEGASSGAANVTSVWYARLRAMVQAAVHVVGASGSDTILVARAILHTNDGDYDDALALLRTECFPTLGRGRDVLLALWRACVVGNEAKTRGRPATPLEAHRARKASPVPSNIGCPYATLYCENYW